MTDTAAPTPTDDIDPAVRRKDRNRLALALIVVAVALGLAWFSSRAVGDPKLVITYLVAAVLHLIAAIWAALRLSGKVS